MYALVFWHDCTGQKCSIVCVGGLLDQISRLPEQPCWLFTLTALRQHSPLSSEVIIQLKTKWAQNAWLEWLYGNWYCHLDISRWLKACGILIMDGIELFGVTVLELFDLHRLSPVGSGNFDQASWRGAGWTDRFWRTHQMVFVTLPSCHCWFAYLCQNEMISHSCNPGCMSSMRLELNIHVNWLCWFQAPKRWQSGLNDFVSYWSPIPPFFIFNTLVPGIGPVRHTAGSWHIYIQCDQGLNTEAIHFSTDSSIDQALTYRQSMQHYGWKSSLNMAMNSLADSWIPPYSQ